MINALGKAISFKNYVLKTSFLQYVLENKLDYYKVLEETMHNKTILFDNQGLIENTVIFEKSSECMIDTINTIDNVNFKQYTHLKYTFLKKDLNLSHLQIQHQKVANFQ